jgi:hypothetical protein
VARDLILSSCDVVKRSCLVHHERGSLGYPRMEIVCGVRKPLWPSYEREADNSRQKERERRME